MNRTDAITEIISYISSIKRALYGRTYRCDDGTHLTASQLGILFIIKHHGPISAHDLSTRLSITAGAVSQTVDTLLERGLIERSPREDSRRTFNLTLSPSGLHKLTEIEQERHAMIEQTTTDLTDEELTIFVRLLQKILLAVQTDKNIHTAERSAENDA